MTATDNSKMSSTPKRTRITYKKRQEIVLASKKPGFKIEDAAKEYGLGVSTLYNIVKEHEGGHGPRDEDEFDLNQCFVEPPSIVITPRKRRPEDNFSGTSRNCRPRLFK